MTEEDIQLAYDVSASRIREVETTLREVFFNNQVSVRNQPTYPMRGDFLIDGKCLLEVDGAKRRFEQIKDLPRSFLAVDGTEVGRGNRIPLWFFGFLNSAQNKRILRPSH